MYGWDILCGISLKFPSKYFTHTLKDEYFIRRGNLRSLYWRARKRFWAAASTWCGLSLRLLISKWQYNHSLLSMDHGNTNRDLQGICTWLMQPLRIWVNVSQLWNGLQASLKISIASNEQLPWHPITPCLQHTRPDNQCTCDISMYSMAITCTHCLWHHMDHPMSNIVFWPVWIMLHVWYQWDKKFMWIYVMNMYLRVFVPCSEKKWG